MQLALTEEETAFREEMRTFFTTKIPQELRDTIAAGRHVGKEGIVESQRIMNEAGIAVPNWPVEWGGQDWTPLQRHIWHEEMQLACVPPPLAFNANMIGPVIANFGSEEQKKKFLPPTANLDIWWAQGFSEPDAGSDLASLKTKAGQGRRRLGGQRPEDLDHARPARRLDLLPLPHRPRRPEEAAGHLDARRADGHRGRGAASDRADRRRLRGQRGVLRGRPRPRLRASIGEENQGWTQAKFLLGNERVGVAPVGATKRALATLKATASETGDLEDPLIASQFIELENELLALELTALRVVANSADGKPHPASSVLKLKGTELQQAVSELAVDLAGPLVAGIRRRRRFGHPRLGARRDAELPQPPQGVDLRRVQRDPAPDHRRHHPGTLRGRRHGLHTRW